MDNVKHINQNIITPEINITKSSQLTDVQQLIYNVNSGISENTAILLEKSITLGLQSSDLNSINITKIIATPELAKALLLQNTGNRNKNKKFIDVWSTVIKKGGWMINGDTISIDSNGNMLDGQHRLEGIIKSNTSIPMILVTNIDPAAYSTKDCGKPRVVKDTFERDGKAYSNKRSAATNVLDAILEKDLSLIQRNPGWAAKYVYSLYKQYEPLFDEMPFKNKYKVNDRLVNAVYVYLLSTNPTRKKEIHTYFDILFTGLLTGNKQPFLMREWLDKQKSETNNNSRNKIVLRLIMKSALKYLDNCKDKTIMNNKSLTFKYLH